MTTVRQVYEAMQAIAPLELAEHWDNPGLLVDCGGQMHRGAGSTGHHPRGGGRSRRKAV